MHRITDHFTHKSEDQGELIIWRFLIRSKEENFEEYKIHLLIFVALWRHPQSPSHSIAFNMSKETIASSDIMFCLTKKKLFQCQFENKFRRIRDLGRCLQVPHLCSKHEHLLVLSYSSLKGSFFGQASHVSEYSVYWCTLTSIL